MDLRVRSATDSLVDRASSARRRGRRLGPPRFSPRDLQGTRPRSEREHSLRRHGVRIGPLRRRGGRAVRPRPILNTAIPLASIARLDHPPPSPRSGFWTPSFRRPHVRASTMGACPSFSRDVACVCDLTSLGRRAHTQLRGRREEPNKNSARVYRECRRFEYNC
jgi:hypothetical protein